MYNLGGRAINAITGKPLVEADKKNPQQFGLTPFYDAARRREAEIDAARGIPRGAYQSPYPEAQKQAPAQQQQAPAPGAVARGTSQYDSVDSGYDDVIAKAATDNGIDPLVLKRLLGTESSFRPDAVSPRGESFGLGIAQIADVHGLSREAKLDPNQAIPFAAQLFAKYLKAANGDYAEAMMKYKGASSAKGRAAMQKPIAEVLGVDLTTAQAPATQPPATQETAAKAAPAQTFSPENVSRFGEQTQQAVRVAQMRISELARSARYATTYQERNDIQKQINTLRYGVYDAQLKNVAVRAATGDAQAVAQLAQEAGVPYAQTQEGFVPVAMGPDGQWRATGQAMNLEVFANQLYSEASGAAAKRRAAQDTANIEAQKQIAVANQQSANAIMLEMAKGESALQQLLMENRIPKDWKVSRDANNPGAPVIVTNSTGVFEIVPGGVDEATGIQMEGSLRRIQ
jgi:soluble lytic murein transglycosylase-like protein